MSALHSDMPEWPVEMPMQRAIVRAMDTLVSFTAKAVANGSLSHGIERFALAGCSKRGTATWGATAVDTRVVMALPSAIGLHGIVEKPMDFTLDGVPHVEYPYTESGDQA